MKLKRKILSYLSNKILYGKKYRSFLSDLIKKENFSDNEKKEWQLKKLNEILEYSKENVPYYTQIFKENKITLPLKNLEEISKIPILTKEIIRNNYKDLISQKKMNSYTVNTGGSTGNPLKLLKSKENYIKEQAFLDYYMKKLGLKSFKCKKAIIRGEYPKYGISEKIGNNLILSSYLISEETIKDYILKLEKFNPEMIHVYPSSIYMISKLIEDNNLSITLPKLKVIVSSSEMFYLEQKKLVSKVFKCKIFDLYGNTENTVHAVNLFPKMNYSFNDFYSYIEIVDDEIISTAFNELAMPLIRYKTNDEIEYLDKNKDEFIIKGRSQDYIYGKNGEKYPVVGIIFGQHFSSFKDIDNFQIRQEKMGEIEFLIQSKKKLTKEKEKEICKVLEECANNSLKVSITYTEILEKTVRGKHKFLVQLI